MIFSIYALINLAINVSGFQMLKMSLTLTPDGFLNRSKVVAAVYECIETMRNEGSNPGNDESFSVSDEIISQYAIMAKLFGYTQAPRPPDAVELAIDSINYGVETVQFGKWCRFPSPSPDDDMGAREDGFSISRELRSVQGAVNSALKMMSDTRNALVIISGGDNLIPKWNPNRFNRVNNDLRPIPPFLWSQETTDIYSENMLSSLSDRSSNKQFFGQELISPPIYNPLIPKSLPPPRIIKTKKKSHNNLDANDQLMKKNTNIHWRVLVQDKNTKQIQTPRCPPEGNCCGVSVLQLLSSCPRIANVEQSAHGELWKDSFEEGAAGLAEQGAQGGLAYEVRFNKYGMRLTFYGPSQTLPEYAKKMVHLLVKHKVQRERLRIIRPVATKDAENAQNLSLIQKNMLLMLYRKLQHKLCHLKVHPFFSHVQMQYRFRREI